MSFGNQAIESARSMKIKDFFIAYLGTGFMPLPIEVFGLGVPERCDPLWFGGNTRGSPNFRYVYILEPSADLVTKYKGSIGQGKANTVT